MNTQTMIQLKIPEPPWTLSAPDDYARAALQDANIQLSIVADSLQTIIEKGCYARILANLKSASALFHKYYGILTISPFVPPRWHYHVLNHEPNVSEEIKAKLTDALIKLGKSSKPDISKLSFLVEDLIGAYINQQYRNGYVCEPSHYALDYLAHHNL